MIGLLPFETTLVCRLSSKFMPLEAQCQDILGFPILKFKVAHTLVIGVAQNAVIKNIRLKDL
jgi:hypothetical protein